MHLMTPKCNDSESFKYSLLLYLYYYNITTNKTRVSQIDNNTTPHLSHLFIVALFVVVRIGRLIMLIIDKSMCLFSSSN